MVQTSARPVGEPAEAEPGVVVQAPPRRQVAPARRSLLVGLATVLVLHAGIFGFLIARGSFVPFVLDGNETFTTLWHAENLNRFGFGVTYGLADEVFNPDRAAHPFLHTHQGNFPRLFSSLLYFIGVRTVEGQIAAATFGIGSIVFLLVYLFLARLASPFYGVLACLALMTDYVLYAQWHVVTYRVWYAFFFFGAFLCVRAIGRRAPTRAFLAMYVLYLGLGYFELVFAAFVSIGAGLYTLALHWRRPKLVVAGWAVQGLGLVSGLAILAMQLTAFLGWSGFVEDLFLTYVARNRAASDPALAARLVEFYATRNIAFWQNVFDAQPLLSSWAIVENLFGYVFQVYTPLLTLSLLALALAWSLSFTADQVSAIVGRTGWRIAAPTRYGGAVAAIALVIGGLALVYAAAVLLAIGRRNGLLGIPVNDAFLSSAVSRSGVILASALVLLVAAIGLLMPRRASGNGPSVGRVLLAAAFTAVMAWFALAQPSLYRQDLSVIWSAVAPVKGVWLQRLALVVVMLTWLIGVVTIVYGQRAILGRPANREFAELARFICCGGVAYSVIWVLAPGYILTGYLVRYAPFVGFVTTPLLTLGLYVVVRAAWTFAVGRRPRLAVDWSEASAGCLGCWSLPIRRWPATAGCIAVLTGWMVGWGAWLTTLAGATVLIALICQLWGSAQLYYLTYLPPDKAAPFTMLRQPPFQGSSYVVNGAAATVAWFAHGWAYLDLKLLGGGVRLTDTGYVVDQDPATYAWFADRATNPAYAKPAYFVCMGDVTFESLALRSMPGGVQSGNCSDLGITKAASAPYWEFLHWRVLARDPTSTDAWTVIQLDWSFPPYLAPLAGTGTERVTATLESDAAGPRVRVHYSYRQQDGEPERGTQVRLYGRGADGAVRILGEARDTDVVAVPADFAGTVWASVTPATADKLGPEYFSATTSVGATAAPATVGCAGSDSFGGDGQTALAISDAGTNYGTVPKLGPIGPDGQPRDAASGDLLFDGARGSLTRLGPDGELRPLVPASGQCVTVANAGAWLAESGRFAGLALIYQDGNWVADVSGLTPASKDILDQPLGTDGPGFRVTAPPGSFSVERLQDERGAFWRIKPLRALPALTVMGQDPLTRQAQGSATVLANARFHGSHGAVTLFDALGPNSAYYSRMVEVPASDDWQILTVSNPAVRVPWPSDNYSVSLLNPRVGDWLDIRALSLVDARVPTAAATDGRSAR